MSATVLSSSVGPDTLIRPLSNPPIDIQPPPHRRHVPRGKFNTANRAQVHLRHFPVLRRVGSDNRLLARSFVSPPCSWPGHDWPFGAGFPPAQPAQPAKINKLPARQQKRRKQLKSTFIIQSHPGRRPRVQLHQLILTLRLRDDRVARARRPARSSTAVSTSPRPVFHSLCFCPGGMAMASPGFTSRVSPRSASVPFPP